MAGLPPLALPSPEGTTRFSVATVAGPFVAASAEMVGPDGPRTVVVGLNVDDVEDSEAHRRAGVAIGVPLLLVVVGLVTWRMVGRTLRPVEDIREEVERISVDRARPARADAGTRRRDRAVGADDERDARPPATRTGAPARFISDASHELRSPVAAIRQHAEVALAHPDSSTLRELADACLPRTPGCRSSWRISWCWRDWTSTHGRSGSTRSTWTTSCSRRRPGSQQTDSQSTRRACRRLASLATR